MIEEKTSKIITILDLEGSTIIVSNDETKVINTDDVKIYVNGQDIFLFIPTQARILLNLFIRGKLSMYAFQDAQNLVGSSSQLKFQRI